MNAPTPPPKKRWIGQSVTRLEDLPLVTGRGRYAAAVSFSHQLYMRVVRSNYAHGRLVAIDATAARAAPGCVAVWTGVDVAHIPPIEFRPTKVQGLEPYRQHVLAQGVVRYVEPQAFTKFSALGVEEQRVNVIGELLSPNPGLGAEYRIEAAIVVDAAEAVLSVPMSALFRRAGQWQVFAVVEGRVQLRELQIGRRNSAQAEVIAGLAEGERVVVFPSDLVLDGIAVRER